MNQTWLGLALMVWAAAAGGEEGDSPRPTFGRCPPERPEGGYRRAALVVAQMGAVPSFLAKSGRPSMEQLRQEELAVAKRLMADLPQSTDPLALLGTVYNRHGNSTEAVKCWEECLRRNPNRAIAYDGLASVAKRKGDYQQAVALWQKALQIDPRMPGGYGRLGEVLLALGKPQEAMAALQREIELAPRPSLSHYLFAQACLQLKDFQEAKRHYQAAVEINPGLTHAYYGLATVCARLGEAEAARQYTAKFQDLKARDAQRGEDLRSPTYDATTVRQGAVQTLIAAGRIYRGHGYLLRAEQLWRRAADVDGENIACRMELAALYRQNQRQAEALKMYEQVIEACEKSGDRAGAAVAARQAVELDPDNAAYRQALERIQAR